MRVVVDAVFQVQLIRGGRSVRVGQAGQDLGGGRDPDRVVRGVRHGRDRVDGGQLGDPQRLGDAAADDRLGLDDVDAAAGEQLDRAGPRVEDLAAGERDVEGGGEPVVALVAAALVDRLLEPDEPEAVQDRAHLDRAREGVAGIPVGHHLEIVGHVVADLLEQPRLVGDRIPPTRNFMAVNPAARIRSTSAGQVSSGSFPSMYPPLAA